MLRYTNIACLVIRLSKGYHYCEFLSRSLHLPQSLLLRGVRRNANGESDQRLSVKKGKNTAYIYDSKLCKICSYI